ncbi:hypothetical protein BDA96_01G122100 [Sorghum bicolor]|uniref:Uncharacterized protein n=2 Tax=Sorghum bicolor TaxID=4558 RepID=A0A921RYG8_SORBI|nr:hypothetical protein BDA96_01G122100 [Sorghum bicolor]KXG37734.1 hypothetical protein SORBI_3001G117100 [Sorghum bicolor]
MAGGGLPTTEVRGSPVATVRVVATGSEEIGSRLNRFGRPRRLHRRLPQGPRRGPISTCPSSGSGSESGSRQDRIAAVSRAATSGSGPEIREILSSSA